MATPRKQKGFRKIVVEGVVYRWRLVLLHSSGTLTIYGESSSSKKLLVELPEWSDPWLNISGFTVEGESLQLHSTSKGGSITNALVRQAILAGVAAGFDPGSRSVTLVLRGGEFRARD